MSSQTPKLAEGTEAMVSLEALVDEVGLRNVAYALARIAYAKSEHVQSNWQDKPLAKSWARDGQALDKLATNKLEN